MRKYFLIASLFFVLPLFAQDFNISLSFQQNHLNVDVRYSGDTTEIILPRQARLFSYKGEESDVFTPQGRIAIRPQGDTEFSYRILVNGTTDYGFLVPTWAPTVSNQEAYNYTLIIEKDFAFPSFYKNYQDNSYLFDSKNIPTLVLTRFSRLTEQGDIPVTVINSATLTAQPDEIRRIYQHNREIFGDRGFDEMIIINHRLLPEDVKVLDKKLFIFMPNRGTLRQFSRLMPDAWQDAVLGMSPRIFAMFKDAALRFRPLSLPPNTEGPFVTDPLWVETSATVDYYKNLFAKGIDEQGKSAALVDVQAPMLIANNSLLRLADQHLGLETFFAGMKALFTKAAPAQAEVNIPVNDTNAISNTDSTNASAVVKIEEKADYLLIDWETLFQGKLQEPFLSFFTNDAFRPNFQALIKVDASNVTRNSTYIPNINIMSGSGETYPIEFQGKHYAPLPVKENWVLLDSERRLPKINYMDSYYTFDRNEQAIQSRILEQERIFSTRRPKITAFRENLEYLSFEAEAGNPYEVEAGTKVYVVVNMVLSTYSGALKPSLQESFWIIQNNIPMNIATRTRF